MSGMLSMLDANSAITVTAIRSCPYPARCLKRAGFDSDASAPLFCHVLVSRLARVVVALGSGIP